MLSWSTKHDFHIVLVSKISNELTTWSEIRLPVAFHYESCKTALEWSQELPLSLSLIIFDDRVLVWFPNPLAAGNDFFQVRWGPLSNRELEWAMCTAQSSLEGPTSKSLCRDFNGFWTLQQELETDDYHATTREKFTLVKNILFVDYSDIFPVHSRETWFDSSGHGPP